MTFFEVIPEPLRDCGKKNEVIEYIAALPIDPLTKKYIMVDWCKTLGCICTEEDYRRVEVW